VNDGDYGGYKTATKFTPSRNGSLTQIGLFCTVVGTPTTRAMVYADNAGVPGALLAKSADKVLAAGPNQDVMWDIPTVALTAGVPIWLAAGFDGSTVQVFCEPAGTGAHSYRADPSASNPFGVATLSVSAGDNSIWAFIGVLDLLSTPGRGSDLSASADTAGDGFIPESIPFSVTGGYGPLQAVPA
jgi:hypothetical protein